MAHQQSRACRGGTKTKNEKNAQISQAGKGTAERSVTLRKHCNKVSQVTVHKTRATLALSLSLLTSVLVTNASLSVTMLGCLLRHCMPISFLRSSISATGQNFNAHLCLPRERGCTKRPTTAAKPCHGLSSQPQYETTRCHLERRLQHSSRGACGREEDRLRSQSLKQRKRRFSADSPSLMRCV